MEKLGYHMKMGKYLKSASKMQRLGIISSPSMQFQSDLSPSNGRYALVLDLKQPFLKQIDQKKYTLNTFLNHKIYKKFETKHLFDIERNLIIICLCKVILESLRITSRSWKLDSCCLNAAKFFLITFLSLNLMH